jgi:hypothetical protein
MNQVKTAPHPTAFQEPNWAMVYDRTHQLAAKAGRSSFEVTQLDYEQAKREITGAADLDEQHAILGRVSP